MNLIFVTEARFFKNAKGDIYGDAAFEKTIWQRYLNIFDQIFIVARVEQNFENIEKKFISSGEKIHFIEIPYYIGPLQYVLQSAKILATIKNLVKTHLDAAFICRIPGNIGDMVIKELHKYKKKYAVEVVGDPDDVFSDKSFSHPLKKYFHKKGIINLKRNISGASSLLYVTKYTLQKKYPAPPKSFSTYASNVMLSSDRIDIKSKSLEKNKTYKILSVGSLDQMYKAPDVALEAVKIYNKKFPLVPIEFIWLGDGAYLQNLQAQCREMKLDNFQFKGQVSALEVEAEMKECDLFVLVSRTEGLPRVIIEAMATGLPIIGTNVGGIPELINENSLIEKNNPEALALKINDILSQPNTYNQLSARNLIEAEEYAPAILRTRREEFYQSIKNNS